MAWLRHGNNPELSALPTNPIFNLPKDKADLFIKLQKRRVPNRLSRPVPCCYIDEYCKPFETARLRPMPHVKHYQVYLLHSAHDSCRQTTCAKCHCWCGQVFWLNFRSRQSKWKSYTTIFIELDDLYSSFSSFEKMEKKLEKKRPPSQCKSSKLSKSTAENVYQIRTKAMITN